jgi:hypothetical protein
MFTWNKILEWFVSGLFQNFVWVIVGIVIVQFFQDRIDRWRFGRWKVLISRGDLVLLEKVISPGKVKHILDVPEDKLVYLKGLVAPFEMLNCDLLEQGPVLGLYAENQKERRFLIRLEKNPKPTQPQAPKVR